MPEPGVYPFRLVAGQQTGEGSLEWFSILPDGTKVLINDPSNPNSLKAFRARTASQPPPSFNAPTYANGKINISWQGTGVLEETTSLPGGWTTSPSQANPQSIDTTGARKFFRLRQ